MGKISARKGVDFMDKPVKGSVSFPEIKGVSRDREDAFGTLLIYWSGGGGGETSTSPIGQTHINSKSGRP